MGVSDFRSLNIFARSMAIFPYFGKITKFLSSIDWCNYVDNILAFENLAFTTLNDSDSKTGFPIEKNLRIN
jgi:hypothetical protein